MIMRPPSRADIRLRCDDVSGSRLQALSDDDRSVVTWRPFFPFSLELLVFLPSVVGTLPHPSSLALVALRWAHRGYISIIESSA